MRIGRHWVLPLALLVMAYAGPSVAQENGGIETLDPQTCVGKRNNPRVKVDLDTMEVKPTCIRVFEDTTIVFKIKSKEPLDHNTVEIFFKDFADFWIRGTNNQFKNYVYVRVPGKHVPKPIYETTQHEYGIRNGDKYIDPRIQVEH